jgi:hypothetical protein
VVAGDLVPDSLDDVLEWVGEADWGSVPGWLGALSLILAFVIFRRDRQNADRSQVDLVGAWGEATYGRRAPDTKTPIQDLTATVHMHMRNASDLPVIVKQLAYEVHTRWAVKESDYSWKIVDAAEPIRAFVYDIQLAPDETKDLTPSEHNVAHLTPTGANQLDMINGVTVRAAWLLVIDTAGRRWVVEPHKSGRAKKVRRRWRPREYMPQEW